MGKVPVVLNVNGPALPAGQVRGLRVARLGRRIYELALSQQGADAPDGRRHFRLYDTIPHPRAALSSARLRRYSAGIAGRSSRRVW